MSMSMSMSMSGRRIDHTAPQDLPAASTRPGIDGRLHVDPRRKKKTPPAEASGGRVVALADYSPTIVSNGASAPSFLASASRST